MSQTPDRPDAVPGWRLALAAVLALLAALTVEFVACVCVALVARVSGWHIGVPMSVALVAGALIAWAIGGAIAVEVAEDSRGAWAAAAVPPVLAMAGLGLAVVVRRAEIDLSLLAGAASALGLALAALAGGRLWAARIRHRDALQ